MTAPWMPPLPRAAIIEHNLQGGRLLYTADQMRQAQADAARAALEQAIQACEAEYSIEGVAQRCAAAIREKLRGIE